MHTRLFYDNFLHFSSEIGISRTFGQSISALFNFANALPFALASEKNDCARAHLQKSGAHLSAL